MYRTDRAPSAVDIAPRKRRLHPEVRASHGARGAGYDLLGHQTVHRERLVMDSAINKAGIVKRTPAEVEVESSDNDPDTILGEGLSDGHGAVIKNCASSIPTTTASPHDREFEWYL